MTATDKTIDIEAIIPKEEEVLVAGIPVRISRLNLREFLALMNIITTGVGHRLGGINFDQDQTAMKGQMIGLLLMAIPGAPDETISFVRQVVHAKDPADQKALAEALRNPDIESFMDILVGVVEQEAPEIQSLLGKAKGHLQRIQSLFRVTGK